MIYYLIAFFSLLLSTVSLVAAPMVPPFERYKNHWKPDFHPGHYPFISELTFRAYSDHVIDHTIETFDPDWVKPGDTIYVNVWFLEWFEEFVHDQIKHPYILISCDVGQWQPHPCTKRLLYDPKLAAWFCKNIIFSNHPKLFQLPMGQNIFTFGDGISNGVNFDGRSGVTWLAELLKLTWEKPFEKKHLLYMNHFPRAFGDRERIVKLFEQAPFCFTKNHSDREFQYTPRYLYYKELAASQFVLSPYGLEIDCVRNWEALVLDCIPIVEHTFADALYEDLPVVLVHDWNEINEAFLNEKYEQLKHLNTDKAYFDYWIRLIKNAQNKIRKGDLSSAQLDATLFSREDLEDLGAILSQKRNQKHSALIYKGLLTSARPLQIAKAFPFISEIRLYDSWINQKTLLDFFHYLEDKSLARSLSKVRLLSTEDTFESLGPPSDATSIFLDLTHYRIALTGSSDYRHTLKRDLTTLYALLKKQTLLCGNMARNEYVKEVLIRFSKETGAAVTTQGNFWFLTKT